MRKLSKKQIIRFCDETIAEINKGETHYLCNALKYYIQAKTFWGKLFGHNKDLSKHIPEFTFENAKKYCNAKIRSDITNSQRTYNKTWWSLLDNGYIYNSNDRIKFLEWIKSQYTTHKEK
jgi:hypothetical protein